MFAFVLSAILISNLLFVSVSAASDPNIGVDITFSSPSSGDSVRGDFNYLSTVIHYDGVLDFVGEAEYYYSDSYFTAPSTEYNSHLATVSFALCMTSFTDLGLTSENCYENAEAALSDMGFTDFETNAATDYPPREDTIGVVMAKKQMLQDGEPFELVNITVRGGGYGSEWASNFLVGTADERNGDHKGFYDSRDRALEFVMDYLRRNTEGKTKLWITGFSRAGAVSGLIGAWFDDNLDSMTGLSYDDIFTYTFEAPASTDKSNLDGKKYSNIFNILNENDPIPRLPFSGNTENGWNFARPGVEKYFDDISADDAEILNEIIGKINPYVNYDIHNFAPAISSVGTTQNSFLNKFFENIASRIDREGYAQKIEAPLCEMIGNITNRDSAELELLVLDIFDGIASDLGISEDIGIAEMIGRINLLISDDSSSAALTAAVGENLVRTGIIDEYSEEVQLCLSALLDIFIKNDSEGTNLLFYIVSIIMNNTEENVNGLRIVGNRIISAHMPEIILGMLMMADSNYTDEPTGYISAPAEGSLVKMEVAVNGKSTHTAYYYMGDSVNVTADTDSCTYVCSWYKDGELLSRSDECSFTASGDVTLMLETVTEHRVLTDWITEREPTSNAEGYRYRICIACGSNAASEMLPALGENDPPAALISLISASGILLISGSIAALLRLRKTKNTDENKNKGDFRQNEKN